MFCSDSPEMSDDLTLLYHLRLQFVFASSYSHFPICWRAQQATTAIGIQSTPASTAQVRFGIPTIADVQLKHQSPMAKRTTASRPRSRTTTCHSNAKPVPPLLLVCSDNQTQIQNPRRVKFHSSNNLKQIGDGGGGV